MKAFKLIAGILVAGLLLLALVIALAFVPSIQTWAARRAVAGIPGTTIAFDQVSAGLSSATIDGLRVEQAGRVITAGKVSARYSVLDYVLRHRVTVDDLAVSDLLVDLRAQAPAPSAQSAGTAAPTALASHQQDKKSAAAPAQSGQPAQFEGLLNQFVLPVDLRVASVSVSGKTLLAGGASAEFEVAVHNLATGGEGTATWKATLTNTAAGAPYRGAKIDGSAKIRISRDRHIDAVTVSTNASVDGPSLPSDTFVLSADVARGAKTEGERYSLRVSDQHDGAAETLVRVDSAFQPASHQITGTWALSLGGARLAALARGFNLPELSLNGEGSFALNPNIGQASTKGSLKAVAARLERVSPNLTGIGGLTLQIAFDAGVDQQTARLSSLQITASASNGERFANVSLLQAVRFSLGTKTVSLDDPQKALAELSLTDVPLAWAQPFARPIDVAGGRLSLAFSVVATADGQHVRVSPTSPVRISNLTLRQAGKTLVAGLELSVKPSIDYSPDTVTATIADLAVSLPTGDSVKGRVTADVTHLSTKPAVAFSCAFQSRLVAALKPYLSAPTGVLTANFETQGTFSGQTLRVTRSTADMAREHGPKLVDVSLLQPLVVDTAKTTVSAESPERNAVRVQLGNVPLSWAQAYVPNASLSGELRSATIEVGIRSLQDLRVETSKPVVLDGVGCVMNGKPLAQDLGLTVDLSASDRANTIEYAVRRLELRGGGTPLVTLGVSGSAKLGEKLAASAEGRIHVDLAALMKQPFAPPAGALTSGILDSDFNAALANTIKATAKLTVRNLVSANDGQSLGDVDLSVDASLGNGGADRLRVPFSLTKGGRTSDLLVDGTLSRTAAGISFDGQITSKNLFTDDLKALAALAPQSGASQPAAQDADAASAGDVSTNSTQTPVRDAKAFWTGAGGRIQLSLDRITYGSNYLVSGVKGSATVTPARLSLDSLAGSLNGNPFNVAAVVNYDAAQPHPYAMTASTKVSNFDIGAFLRATNPGEPPQLETTVTVNANLQGQGSNAIDLAQHVRGTFDVAGTKGVLRALSKKSGDTVSALSTVAGLFGAVTGRQGTVAVAELAKKLSEMPFDTFALHAERAADFNLKVTKIEFTSPDTRLTGSGQITYQKGVPIQNQQMQFTLQLAGKAGMAYLLNQAHLLGGQQDDQGYYTMGTAFTLKGTPTKPNSNDLWRIIAQAALGAALGGG